jgi:DNA-directed RNA polymerase sigma subunit (sigma70/sigma32)
MTDEDEMAVLTWQRASPGYEKDRALDAMMARLKGVVGQVLQVYNAASVPRITLELEARRQAAMALAEYKPGMGAKVSSFLSTRLRQRLFRYVSEHQNVARIPEAQVRLITPFKNALTDLTERLGRDPSTHELADHMRVPPAKIRNMRRMLRPTSIGAEDESEGAILEDVDFDKAMFVYYDLTEQEKSAFDMLMGAHGQTRVSAGEIASRLRVSPARVSALKQSIAEKIQKHIG